MLDNLIYFVEHHKEMFIELNESMISKSNYDVYIESYIKEILHWLP